MSEEDNGSCCCPCLTPDQRKIGYYITYGVGLLLFGFGVLNIFNIIFNSNSSSPAYLIAGSLLIIFDPLWIKNCSGLLSDMKSPGRVSSTILFVASNAALIVGFYIIQIGFLNIIFTVCVVLTGIWYFLSFFPGAQNGCLACMKNCCCSGDSGGETA